MSDDEDAQNAERRTEFDRGFDHWMEDPDFADAYRQERAWIEQSSCDHLWMTEAPDRGWEVCARDCGARRPTGRQRRRPGGPDEPAPDEATKPSGGPQG